MDHYIDIKILPDPEFLETTLINALFSSLHRALVRYGKGDIGVSFPKFKKTLGDIIRLHGSKLALEHLMSERWLNGLTDYIQVAPIEPIPVGVKYRLVRRVQVKSSVYRLQRRSVAKGWLTQEEAEAKITLDKEQRLNLPFLQIKSKSSGQTFRLFVEHGELADRPIVGKFSTYGLSNKATVPWF